MSASSIEAVPPSTGLQISVRDTGRHSPTLSVSQSDCDMARDVPSTALLEIRTGDTVLNKK